MIKFSKKKFLVFNFVSFILVLNSFYYFYPIEVSVNNTPIAVLNRSEINYPSVNVTNTVLNKPVTNCTKWIVITTISLPTDDVKYLHSSFDWCVVVVADKKTPDNWSYKNIIFLSIEKQKEMAKKFKVPYKIKKLIHFACSDRFYYFI